MFRSEAFCHLLNVWFGCDFPGEAVIGGGKQQKKNGVADGKNRKALGDIGNLANVRGVVEVKPHRPITRFPFTFSFSLFSHFFIWLFRRSC